MATRCLAQMSDGQQCGQLFDESGYCVNRHEDQQAVADDLARLGAGDSCEDPPCSVCNQPLEKHTAKELAKCHPVTLDPDAVMAS